MEKLDSILLIDDDELINFIHSRYFALLKVAENIEVALNGMEALKLLQNPSNPIPDLIFLDIDMPVMNGFEFLNELERQCETIYKNTNIIIITNSLDIQDMIKANNYKISGYLTKPLSKEMLQEIIKNI